MIWGPTNKLYLIQVAVSRTQVVFLLCLQDDIIRPVRKALEYYQDMQNAIEEEKTKRDKTKDKKAKNGIKNNLVERTAKVQW